jgi:hypothetical protein
MAAMNARMVHMALRGTAGLLAVLAAAQVLLAGSFLSGHYAVLQWHMVAGMSMVLLALVQAVVVFLPGRRERPRQLLQQGIALPIAIAVQGVLGSFRILELHVPIGVLMVIGLVQMAAWAWRTPVPASSATKKPAGNAAAESAGGATMVTAGGAIVEAAGGATVKPAGSAAMSNEVTA